MHRLIAVSLFATVIALPAFGGTMFVYPQKGQDAAQQATDEAECQVWARNQTGYDPMRAPGSSRSAAGGAVRGGAGGAALGAAIGAVSGNAGRGAKIGAVSGGMMGGMSTRSNNRRKESNQQSAHDQFIRAYRTCMGGRGYTIS